MDFSNYIIPTYLVSIPKFMEYTNKEHKAELHDGQKSGTE